MREVNDEVKELSNKKNETADPLEDSDDEFLKRPETKYPLIKRP